MRAVLTTKGSRGDVQPLIALGRHLVRAGHSVVFCSSPDTREMAEAHGLAFRDMGRDFQAFFDEAGHNMANPVSLVRELARYFESELTAQLDVLTEACRNADIVVAAGLLIAGASVAEAARIPYLYAAFAPAWIPTGAFPASIFSLHTMPAWINKATWSVQGAIFNTMMRGKLNARRTRLGLPPVEDMLFHVGGEHCVLANDPDVCPIPDDMVPRPAQTGAFVLASSSTALEPGLEAFLSSGPRPIYLGFGSMVDKDPARTTQLIVDAVKQVDARIVLSRGWAKLGEGSVPDHVFVVGNAPHDVLFRRVSAVVHHGGAGTTAAAARSGVPQLVVPHLVDQFFWGDRVCRLGIAPAPIPRKRLRADNLAHALRQCLSDEKMQSRAAEIGGKLRALDGIARMAELMEARVAARGKGAATPSLAAGV